MEPSSLQVSGLTVHAGFAHEIMHEGQIIHHFTQRRDGFRQMLAALSMAREGKR